MNENQQKKKRKKKTTHDYRKRCTWAPAIGGTRHTCCSAQRIKDKMENFKRKLETRKMNKLETPELKTIKKTLCHRFKNNFIHVSKPKLSTNHQQAYTKGMGNGVLHSLDKTKMIPDKSSEIQGRMKGNARDKYVGKWTLTV